MSVPAASLASEQTRDPSETFSSEFFPSNFFSLSLCLCTIIKCNHKAPGYVHLRHCSEIVCNQSMSEIHLTSCLNTRSVSGHGFPTQLNRAVIFNVIIYTCGKMSTVTKAILT